MGRISTLLEARLQWSKDRLQDKYCILQISIWLVQSHGVITAKKLEFFPQEPVDWSITNKGNRKARRAAAAAVAATEQLPIAPAEPASKWVPVNPTPSGTAAIKEPTARGGDSRPQMALGTFETAGSSGAIPGMPLVPPPGESISP